MATYDRNSVVLKKGDYVKLVPEAAYNYSTLSTNEVYCVKETSYDKIHILTNGGLTVKCNSFNFEKVDSDSEKLERIKYLVVDSVCNKILSKHNDLDVAKDAISKLLRKNPTARYNLFIYLSTGEYPQMPVNWSVYA